MSGTIWTKFFWSDWESDKALALCSLAAQGLWMRMLCIAAQHDPIGYVAVAGLPLSVTDLARLTGASETEAEALLVDLERNGVFSRDRLGRIYSRRLIKDAKASAEAKKNGKLGGNPNLWNNKPNPPGVKPQVKGRDKPQKPSASTKVEAPNSASNLSEAKNDFLGPKEVRQAFEAQLGDDWCRSYLDHCGWQDVPERALIPASRYAGQKLVREARAVLSKLGLTVLDKVA